MKISRFWLNRVRARRRAGFSLVITILMMVLLTTLALGLLSLSAVSLRAADAGSAMATARANARVALMLAVAELQKQVGPDQRVTTDGSRDADPARKHWMGVYKTTQGDGAGETPVVKWDTSTSSVVDSRSGGAVNADSLFQGWLVSGWPNPGSDRVELVSTGSVSSPDDQVKVPLIPVDNGNGRPGGMAYWVSDESIKASLGVPDYLAGKQPETPGDDGYRRMMMPQNAGIEVLPDFGGYEKASSGDLEKAIDFQQAALSGKWGAAPLQKNFHSLAAVSNGVLSDTMRSGLKRDLSIFLESGSVPGRGSLPAVTETTSILEGSKRQVQGPKFGVLRSWAKLADEVSTDGSITPRASQKTIKDGFSKGGVLKYDKLPDLSAGNMPIGPVIASTQLYTRFSYYRGYILIHLYPRIVLWNPYNVALKASAYSMDMNFAFSDDGKLVKAGAILPDTYEYSSRDNKENRLRLSLEPTEFEAGEALVFTPAVGSPSIGGNSTMMGQRGSGGANLMSAKANPSALNNFYLTIKAAPSTVTAADLPLNFNHNEGSYYAEWMDWYEANEANGMKVSLHLGAASTYNDLMANPVLQVVDMDNWKREYGGRFNSGRWRIAGVEPLYDYESTPNLLPWGRAAYGFRYKWPVEVNASNMTARGSSRYWEAGVNSDFNLRAPVCYRSPYDNVSDNGEDHHWYNWGPFASDRLEALPYNSPDLAAQQNAKGYYRANPFFAGSRMSGDTVYPKYDLPTNSERLVSIGSFQHAPLSPFVWHPAYPVGSSWVPPNLKDRARSADTQASVKSQWETEIKFLPSWYRQSPGNDETVYDLAYEANYDLWDRYYLSGSVQNERAGFISQPTVKRMPNVRIVPRPDTGIQESKLNDFYQAASQVLLAGSFNVNSMNRDAWKAQLASLRDIQIPSKGHGGSALEGTPFSRFRTPPSGADKPSDGYKTEEWSGYRKITDEELDKLATELVEVVRERGPFLSVADFINRRLVPIGTGNVADQGLMGALDQAISRTDLNQALNTGDYSMRMTGFGTGAYEPGNTEAVWGEKSHQRTSKATGMPGFLQQGDILQTLGSTLTARGDTFRVRSYGEARDGSNKVVARAWCEAVVQRLPDYLDPSDAAETPAFNPDGTANNNLNQTNRTFGRRCQIASFRWMQPSEV